MTTATEVEGDTGGVYTPEAGSMCPSPNKSQASASSFCTSKGTELPWGTLGTWNGKTFSTAG
ncbi:hypothetical protein D3C79_719250 [compost metagenome]